MMAPSKALPSSPNRYPLAIASSGKQGSSLSWHSDQRAGETALFSEVHLQDPLWVIGRTHAIGILHWEDSRHLAKVPESRRAGLGVTPDSCCQSHPQLNVKWVIRSLPPPLAKESNEAVFFKSISQTSLSFQLLPARNLPSVGRGKLYTQGTWRN